MGEEVHGEGGGEEKERVEGVLGESGVRRGDLE